MLWGLCKAGNYWVYSGGKHFSNMSGTCPCCKNGGQGPTSPQRTGQFFSVWGTDGEFLVNHTKMTPVVLLSTPCAQCKHRWDNHTSSGHGACSMCQCPRFSVLSPYPLSILGIRVSVQYKCTLGCKDTGVITLFTSVETCKCKKGG